MNKKLIITYIAYDFISLFFTGLVLFWSAGRMNWWSAWAALLVLAGWLAGMDYVLFRFNPELMHERVVPPKSAKSWDRVVVSLIRLLQLARYILAGLDQRFGWTGEFPMLIQVTAFVMCALAFALFVWAMYSNAFFSQVIRIQTDRGHTVAAGGPYRFVRHPGYLGGLLSEIALATLLGSWWALAIAGVCSILFILRTALEDRTLHAELPGYAVYASKVRYRLLPGIW